MARFGWVLLCLTISAILGFLVTWQAHQKRDAFALSTVKVNAGEGHGSGVHTGSRFIVTAAHVVKGHKTVTVKASHGGESRADVLWINEAHDIALLRARELQGVAVSVLKCDRDASVGQNIHAIGNPGPLEFVHAYGRVASKIEKRAHWNESFIASLAVAPGMSGGPVLNERGSVVGIIVGVALMQVGWGHSAISFAYVVPAASVCKMLARSRNNG